MAIYDFDQNAAHGIPEDVYQQLLDTGLSAEGINKAVATIRRFQEQKNEIINDRSGLIPGPPCPVCKDEWYRRTGVCLMCANCGESSSCG